MKRLLSLVGIVLFLAAGQASANITFTFSGVMFSDGGTLAGTFVTDNTLTTLIDYDITTSPGSGIGFTYIPATTVSFSSLPGIIVVETSGLENLLQVTFDGGLTATGASILVGTFDSFEQGPDNRRDIIAGSATVGTSVPEPAALALLGIGLVGLGFSRRRKLT